MEKIKTPLTKLTNIWKDKKIPGLFYLKDESANPFGTIKDRRNYYVIQEAVRLGVDKLVLITSGNNGYSLSKFAEGTSIKVVCIVNKDLPQNLKQLLSSVAYQVIELNLNHKILRPEELIAFARETDEEVIWDVTNGYEDYYAPIVDEILSRVVPDYIVVPVGSGGVFVGFAQEVAKLNLRTKIIGLGVQNSIHSFADKLSTPWTPYTRAMETYQTFGHEVIRLNEEEVRNCYKQYKNVCVSEPSSNIVFAISDKKKFEKKDVVVLVNTGKIKP